MKKYIYEKCFDLAELNICRKKSHYARCLALELLCNNLCGPLPKNLESPCLYELDTHSQTRRRECHCWELQDEPFAFCGRICTACVDLLNRVFSPHLIGFVLRATEQERKSALWRLRHCVSRRPWQCILQVGGNTLQQVETFKYLGVVFTSDGSWNKRIDTGIGKENATLRESCCSVVSFYRPKSFQFSNETLFRSSPVVMNHRWRRKKYCQKNKRQRWDICEEFYVWHFVTKCTALISVKPGIFKPLLRLQRSSYVSSAMCPECPRKAWRTNSFGLQSAPTLERPRVRPRTRWRDYISDLAWSRFGVEPAELLYLRLLLLVRYFGST